MPINSSAAEVLTAYLVAQGLLSRPADKTAWPTTTTAISDEMPDNRISIQNPDVEIQGKNMRTGETYFSPICQIRVRSVPASAGYTKIQQILAALSSVQNASVTTNLNETVALVTVTLVSGPSFMGQEEKNQRQHHVMNVKVITTLPGT